MLECVARPLVGLGRPLRFDTRATSDPLVGRGLGNVVGHAEFDARSNGDGPVERISTQNVQFKLQALQSALDRSNESCKIRISTKPYVGLKPLRSSK